MSSEYLPLELSERLLYAVKLKKENGNLVQGLRDLSMDELKAVLTTDNKKFVFWINLYNAYYQILKLTGKYEKMEIYKAKDIHLAQDTFSLDEIEHGILRKNRHKLSLGLLPNPFTRSVIKELAVEELDYRIHFALNCGAKSCPPIAFYKLDSIDDQLDLATVSFLEGESELDHDSKIVTTTSLFLWFKFDFGGEKGIREIYKKQLETNIDDYKIAYRKYSWEEHLGNFVE